MVKLIIACLFYLAVWAAGVWLACFFDIYNMLALMVCGGVVSYVAGRGFDGIYFH